MKNQINETNPNKKSFFIIAVIVGVIAVGVVGFVSWKYFGSSLTDMTKSNDVVKYEDAVNPEKDEGKIDYIANIAYQCYPNPDRQKAYKADVIYNGKNMGDGYSIKLLGNNIAFGREIDGKCHVIYNGNDLGKAGSPYLCHDIKLSGDHIAFLRKFDTNSASDACHLIYDNHDLGNLSCISGNFQLSGDNLVYRNDQYHIIFNGQDLGEGKGVFLSGDNIAFTKKIDDKYHIIFNGKDLGQGKSIRLSGNNIAFIKEIDGKSHIIFNGKDMGEGSYVKLSGSNIVFTRKIDGKSYIILNGQNIGEGNYVGLSGDNIAFEREIKGKNHVIFNGKDMGEKVPVFPKSTGRFGIPVFAMPAPQNFQLSGDNIAFERRIKGKSHLIFNEKDLGEVGEWKILDNNIAFERRINGNTHIIFNGKDLGIGSHPMLSKPIQK